MHIVLITDNLSQQGGAERYFHELAANLRAEPTIKVTCLGFGSSNTPDCIAYPPLKNPLAKLFYRFIVNPVLLYRLRQQLRTLAPDIIHLHNCKQYSATVFLALRGYCVIQTTHDFSYLCPTSQNIHRDGKACPTGLTWQCFWQHQVKFSKPVFLVMALHWWLMQRSAKKLLKKCLAPSPFLTRYLEQRHFPAPEYLPPFKPAPINYQTKSDDGYFLFAGQLATHKGIWLLCYAFQSAVALQPHLRLIVAGKGPEEKALQRWITTHQLTKNIQLIGWQTDLSSYYQRARAVVFPSTGLESFGLVLTESMRYAKPIIAINQGTAAWLVQHNETGLLFDPGHPEALTQALITLANDPKLAQQFGAAGLKLFESLPSNEEILKSLLRIYQATILQFKAGQPNCAQSGLSEELKEY